MDVQIGQQDTWRMPAMAVSPVHTWLEHLEPSGHHTFSKKHVIQLISSELASGSSWRAADMPRREGLKK